MKLRDTQREALKKLGDMGATNAASALSVMVQEPVSITVPHMDILPVTRIFEMVDGEDEAVGMYSQISGDLDATIVLVFKESHAGHLVKTLMGNMVGEVENIEEMAMSAIQEVGNIMISAFSNALADFLGSKVIPSPPAVGVDMAGALVDSIIIEIGMSTEETYCFHTDFVMDPGPLMGHLFLILEPGPMEKFLEKLRKKVRT